MDLYASSNRLKYIDKSIHVNDKEWSVQYLHEYLFYVMLCKKIMENRWGKETWETILKEWSNTLKHCKEYSNLNMSILL